jgi:hypothetical protein
MDCFCPITSCEFELLLVENLVAILLAADRTSGELDVLAAAFASIGTLLASIAVLRAAEEASQGTDQCIKELQKRIKRLEDNCR